MSATLPITGAEIAAVLHEQLFPQDPEALLAVWLYGSAARDELRSDSDVDLAFLASRPVGSYEVFVVAQALAARLQRDVDLVNLSRAGTILRSQVVTGGHRIHTADPVRAESFEMFVLADYARLNEERREALASFKERYGV